MVDSSAFELGKNVATAPGSVVFQNDLMQLLQFSPTTDTVFRRPAWRSHFWKRCPMAAGAISPI
jgi:poly(3-hydroxyalkanoate) synthetase